MGREEFSEKERVEFVRWFCTWLDGQLDTLAPAERDGVLAAIVDTMKQAEDAIDRQVERLSAARQTLVDAGIPVNDVDVAIGRLVHQA